MVPRTYITILISPITVVNKTYNYTYRPYKLLITQVITYGDPPRVRGLGV